MVGSLMGDREIRLELLDYPGEWLLDRFDGLLFALPVAFYLCRVLNIG